MVATVVYNINLHGKGKASIILPEELLLTARGKMAEHMTSTLFRHSRIDGSIRARSGTRDIWEYLGSSIGYDVGQALAQKEGTYGYGFSIVPFDCGVGVSTVRRSNSPSSEIYIYIGDRDLRDSVRRFLRGFSREGKLDISFIAFPTNIFSNEEYFYSNKAVADHHSIEAGFKAFADALDKVKRISSEPLAIDIRKRATTHLRETGETRYRIRLKVYGGSGRYVNPHSYDDSRYLRESDRTMRMMIESSSFDLEILEAEDDHVGEEIHHAVEDKGITIGEALAKEIGDGLGLTRFGYDVQLCECGNIAIAALDISKRPAMGHHLYKNPDTRFQELQQHSIEQMFLKAGVDSYIATLPPDSKVYGDVHDLLIGLFRQPEYHLAANSIKGNKFSLPTDHDSEFHREEMLSIVVGRALKQATSKDALRLGIIPSTKESW